MKPPMTMARTAVKIMPMLSSCVDVAYDLNTENSARAFCGVADYSPR
jgi:hypothetical protein